MQENNTVQTELKLINRNNLTLSGVEKVLGSNENRISAVVAGSTVLIIGSGLRVVKLDTETGVFESQGQVNEIRFLGVKGGLFKNIFK